MTKKIDEAKAKADAEAEAKAAKMRPRRKGSGEVGAEEDKQRREQEAAKLEKQAKAIREGSYFPERDALSVVGVVTSDAHDAHEAEPFEFDQGAETKVVDHIAVASNSSELWLEIDGAYYAFDAQLAAGLRRLIDNATTNLNL